MPNNTLSKRKPSIDLSGLPQLIDATVMGNVRGVIVSRSGDGFSVQEVHQGESVLNIRTDLISHLNECAYPDDWLNHLMHSIDQRLIRRRIAQQAGALSVPGRNGWESIAVK